MMKMGHGTYDTRHSSTLLLIPFLHLLCCSGGKCLEVVKTSVGEVAVLPCEVDPTTPDVVVHWTKQDLPPGRSGLYYQRNQQEFNVDKNPAFEGRTSLFMDEVKNGNMSLTLSNVTLSDEGNYTCHLPEVNKKITVQLIVGRRSLPTKASLRNAPSSKAEQSYGEFHPWIIPGFVVFLSVLV